MEIKFRGSAVGSISLGDTLKSAVAHLETKKYTYDKPKLQLEEMSEFFLKNSPCDNMRHLLVNPCVFRDRFEYDLQKNKHDNLYCFQLIRHKTKENA